MAVDYIMNGVGYGSVAAMLIANGGDPDCLRPWIGADGRHYQNRTINGEKVAVPLNNTVATLTRDAWDKLDDAVQKISHPRMGFVTRLRSLGLERSINGLSTPVITWQRASGLTGATTSMDGMRQGERDRQTVDLVGVPIPLIHKDLSFSLREVLISAQGNMRVDTSAISESVINCAEEAEKLAFGTSGSYSYAGYTVYGVLNHPDRNTKVLTDPTSASWVPATLIGEVLAMIQQLTDDGFYGKYDMLMSPAWDQYMEADYSAAAPGTGTLLERIKRISRIGNADYYDFLGAGLRIVLIQMDSRVIQEAVGMEFQTIQYQSPDGFELGYKVIGCFVPIVKSDRSGNSGINDGAVP